MINNYTFIDHSSIEHLPMSGIHQLLIKYIIL